MRHFKLLIVILTVSLLAASCASEPAGVRALRTAPVFPEADWAASTPAAQGLDPLRLDTALAYLARHCGADGLDQTVVIKNGYLVWAGDSIDVRHNIYSCTKGLTSAAMNLLRVDGALELNDRAATFEPLLSDRYGDVRIWHFASMTSGYSARGASRWGEPSEDWGWTPYLPDAPYFAPGEAYAYWDEAQMMYGRVLTQAAQRDLYALLDERIMRPIGVGDAWRWDPEGRLALATGDSVPIRNGCTGIQLTARELARVGWLYANAGVWAGDTLLPPLYARKQLTAQVPAELPVGPTDRDHVRGPGVYGYGWWAASPDSGAEHALPHAPADAAYLSGFNHNVCLVVPSEGLVLVRMGDDGNPAAGKYRVYDGVLARLLGPT